jgi:Uma2 family endonuclease
MRAFGSGVKLTYDDFLQFPDDGKMHELIDGVHYVTPSASTRHQRISGRLFLSIGKWQEAHPVGEVFFAPYDVVLSQYDIVEPDILYFSNERAASVLTRLHATGAPNIVIEIASPGTRRRDDTIKKQLYERVGVSEYWTVDPEKDAIRIHRLEDGAFGPPTELSRQAEDLLVTPLLPGLEISLAQIFRD